MAMVLTSVASEMFDSNLIQITASNVFINQLVSYSFSQPIYYVITMKRKCQTNSFMRSHICQNVYATIPHYFHIFQNDVYIT